MKNNYIEIVNGSENNLKNINLKVPKNKISVFTGVSGSGKSSIVFDTIGQEAQRLINETYSSYVRTFLPKFSAPHVDSIHNISPAIVIDQKGLGGSSRSTLGTVSEINNVLRVLFSRFGENKMPAMNHYSFNDPHGMCPDCSGIGKVVTLDLEKSIDYDLSINEGAIKLPGYSGKMTKTVYEALGSIDLDKPIKKFSKKELDLLLYGDGIKIDMGGFQMNYEGIVTKFIRSNVNAQKEASAKTQEKMAQFTHEVVCEKCEGKRYNDDVLKSTYAGLNIYDITNMELDKLLVVLKDIKDEKAQVVVDQLTKKVQDLVDIGLGYLSLTRETNTLSGGESQRVKMVKYLSSSLCDMIYILDEPSTGLHPKDVYRLNELLQKIRDKGNTVIVVEHDPDVIKIADHIVDVGPKAGKHGGNITFEGTYDQLLTSETLTGQFLSRENQVNEEPKSSKDFYTSSKSSVHNLKDIALKVPKEVFTVVCGVAGSGKSTLVTKAFMPEHEDNIIYVDQTRIHTNVRSTPLTYLGIVANVRKLFAAQTGADLSLFSPNSKGGCPTCGGKGKVEINISFMDPVTMDCEDCHGSGYINEVLQYKYKDLNIVEVMNLSVDDALEFFEDKKILKVLTDLQLVGLGYITLGQSLSTFSGGECQRLKLASQISKKGSIYILDEPTTGLHMSDVDNILNIIKHLVKTKNTVIVIEHNTDIIKQADYVVEIGPDGGTNGGNIIHEGTVVEMLNNPKSVTKDYL